MIGSSVLVLKSHANQVEKPYLESEETWRRANLVEVASSYDLDRKSDANTTFVRDTLVRGRRVDSTADNTNITRHPYTAEKNSSGVHGEKKDDIVEVIHPLPHNHRPRTSGPSTGPSTSPSTGHFSYFSFVAAPVILGITTVSTVTVVAIALCILCKRKTLQ